MGEKMKRFIIYNFQGQTAGSFIISTLQEIGIPCIDEFFNKDRNYPGDNFGKVFRSDFYAKSRRPTSVYEAFTLLQKSDPIGGKHLGLKLCGWQTKRCSDFEAVLGDESILKVFLSRQDEIKLYLTRFFYNKSRLKSKMGFSSMHYSPHPFGIYQKLKTISKGIALEVECEDFFDFRVNTATKFCQLLGFNDSEIKKLCIQKILNCTVEPLKKILTSAELSGMADFFQQKYSIEVLNDLQVRDCRNVCQNLGFL
jgi:hypothetical protein